MTVDTDEDRPVVAPVYPYNEPGQPITLFDGFVGGLSDKDFRGRVELRTVPGLDLAWTIEPEPGDYTGPGGEVALVLRQPGGDLVLPAGQRNADSGWTNGLEIGDPTTPLVRVVAHWFNLPELGSAFTEVTGIQTDLHHEEGRWLISVGDWLIEGNRRADFKEVWQNLHNADVFLMTHVVEVRQANGSTFTAADVGPVLDALHIGVSFALGRWVALGLPVGLDEHDRRVWEQWRSPICDPARAIHSGWWDEKRIDALQEFLSCVIAVFADPDELAAQRLRLMFGTTATSERGFMEQRIMMGGVTLEHITWQQLVLNGQLTKKQYKDKPAHERLRGLLTNAKISLNVDPQILPVLAQYLADESVRQGRNLDGPDIVTQVRNRLMHPEGQQEQVYDRAGLLTDAWCQTRHYATLLILHALGYNGACRDLRRITESVIDTVPWKEHP